MCGIAGLMTVSGGEPDLAALRMMSAALAHRGPDGDSEYVSAGVALAHRRLAIIDLETGEQPFKTADGAALIANGEIYNYIELRAEMAGTEFATRSDCEVPLHLYGTLGEKYSERLRGMYAIALHDAASRRLYLTRDPFGIKPLYYVEGSFGFAFASEPQAFFKAGLLNPELRETAVEELLQLQFTTGAETAYRDVFRVLPGETLVVEAGRIVERFRQPALPAGGPESTSEEAALAAIDSALTDSVEIHQRSDVPYGMFLSGGIDSSAVLALMARLNENPVLAYTIGFSGTRAQDERDHAREVAAAVGARHVEIDFSEDDFWSLAPRVAKIMDDPVADYAELPTYKLAEIASKDVKVVLCGEGGDEIFGGYGRYRSVMRPWRFMRRAMRSRGALTGLGVLRVESRDWRQGMVLAAEAADMPGRSPLQIAQATDCADWLPHDLLGKLDRCLMAHGVEGRTPMLDPVVANAAFCLPDRLKVRGKSGKWILRQWLQGVLPAAAPFARKRGFTVPVGEWIIRRGTTLGPLVAKQPAIQQICDPVAVEKLFRTSNRRAGFAAWILMFYALWHLCHIEGKAMEGDVFAVLGDG